MFDIFFLNYLGFWDIWKCRKWTNETLVLGNYESVSFPQQLSVVIATWLIQICQAQAE